MSNFHPLEVVGRGCETQLRVGENLNQLNHRIWVNKLFLSSTMHCGDIVWCHVLDGQII